MGEEDPAGEGDTVNGGGGAGRDQDDEERNSQDGGEVSQHVLHSGTFSAPTVIFTVLALHCN